MSKIQRPILNGGWRWYRDLVAEDLIPHCYQISGTPQTELELRNITAAMNQVGDFLQFDTLPGIKVLRWGWKITPDGVLLWKTAFNNVKDKSVEFSETPIQPLYEATREKFRRMLLAEIRRLRKESSVIAIPTTEISETRQMQYAELRTRLLSLEEEVKYLKIMHEAGMRVIRAYHEVEKAKQDQASLFETELKQLVKKYSV